MGLFLILSVVLLGVLIWDKINGNDMMIHILSTIFIVVICFSFVSCWHTNINRIADMVSYYENNKEIQSKIVKEFNKLSVINNNENGNIVNVDNMQQSSKTSDMIKDYMQNVINYNKTLIYYKETRKKNIITWLMFGPLPELPEKLATIDIKL